MQAKIKIEKTDVKIFELVIDVDENELKQWAIDHYGAPDEFEDDESPDLTLDEDGNEVPRTEPDPDWFYPHLSEYLSEQDADVLFLDNCHDHSKYDLETEECVVVQSGIVPFTGEV